MTEEAIVHAEIPEVQKYWWDFFWCEEEVRKRLAEWAGKATPTAMDYEIQQRRIAELEEQLNRLKSRMSVSFPELQALAAKWALTEEQWARFNALLPRVENGLFIEGTLESAAFVLTMEQGWVNGEWITVLEQMTQAAKDGTLIVRHPATGLPDQSLPPHFAHVTAKDVNAWFASQGAPYQLGEKGLTSNADQPVRLEPSMGADCITCPPQKPDDWYEVIEAMAVDFHREYQRCPTAAEAWGRLRNNPPKTYGITCVVDKGGEQAIRLGVENLSKTAFNQRWKRYTKPRQE